jgi:hypothetical protein
VVEPTCDDTALSGIYCGGNGGPIVDGDPQTLYRCDGPGGPANVAEDCSLGCVVAGADEDDHCAVAPTTVAATLPATCGSTAHTGFYCNGDKVSGGNSTTLYRCHGPGTASVAQSCANGCAVAPAGSDDHCDTAPPRPTCTSTAHTGDYCGGDKVAHGDSRTLYRCNGPGTAAKIQACANGCTVVPAGSDDHCAAAPVIPTCTSTAHTGDYCGGDKVANGHASTLYHCNGPGHATVVQACANGCTVAPAGSDDHCAVPAPPPSSCPHRPQLKFGLHPVASDLLRCAGITADRVLQTIGNAAASAGTHAQDGVVDGLAYSAATDISVSGMSDSQVRTLVSRLDSLGFAAFYRDPGHDGWPSGEIRHMHIVYAGCRMKASLQSQIHDFENNRNGLASHTFYSFYQATLAQKQKVLSLFNRFN